MWIGATAAEHLAERRHLALHSVFTTSVNLALVLPSGGVRANGTGPSPYRGGPSPLVHVGPLPPASSARTSFLQSPYGVQLDPAAWSSWHRLVRAAERSGRSPWWSWDPATGQLRNLPLGTADLDLGDRWRSCIGDPATPQVTGSLRPASRALAALPLPPSGLVNGPAGGGSDVQRRVRDAVRGLVDGSIEQARWLLGRGPGLTPSGDDILVGVLAALHLAGLPGRAAQANSDLAAEIAHSGRRLTTDISCAYLADAVRGRFAGPLRRVLEALAAIVGAAPDQSRPGSANLVVEPDLTIAVRALAELGHSSGADTLVGLDCALREIAQSPTLLSSCSPARLEAV